MSRSYWRRLCVCLVILSTSQLVLGEEMHESWRADFDNGTLDGASKPVFINGISKESEPDRLIFDSQQGVITLGGQFDNTDDYAELTWPKLGDLSLQKTPMLEMRVRHTPSSPEFWMEVQPTYKTASGSPKTITRYLTFQAGEWQTTAWRLAANDPLPEEWLPQTMVGLTIRIHSNRPSEVEIDWVRLREFNAAERQREEKWHSLVCDGPPVEPVVLREFFPFGVYDASSDIGIHHVTHRHAFDVMAKHHLNYKQAGFITPLALEAGAKTGMRMSVHARLILEHFEKGGADAAIAFIKPAVDVIADDQVVIGYDIGDERPLTDLWSAAASARILEQLDPTRFSSLCFFTEPYIPAYDPYLCLYLTDIYPLGFHKRGGAKYLYEWCYNVAKQTQNKRHWIILQAFGDSSSRRWRPGGILPTVAELRLMTYGAIAGGARGIIYYTFNGDLFESLVDQWCNPLNDLLDEVSRLGERLIPIGRRLLDVEVDFNRIVENDNEAEVIVGVLHSPTRDVNYLVVVNQNVEQSQTASLTLPEDWRDREVLDMTRLRTVSGELRGTLLPGDGHVYMVGSTEQCRAEADAVLANRIEEFLRVLKTERSTAEGWEIDVSEVLHIQRDAETSIRKGIGLDVAETNVRKAGKILEAQLATCEPYARIKSHLDRIGHRMGEVEYAMYDDNVDSAIVKVMGGFRQPYWRLHARWAEAYGMLLEGKKNGLSLRVEALVSDSEHLLVDVRKSLANRPKSSKEQSGFGLTSPLKARYIDGQDCLDFLPKLEVVEKLPYEGWLFKDDREKVGVDRGYFKPDHPTAEFTKSRIGSFWDHQGDASLEEGWYRLRYKCPKVPEGKRVFLHFGAVDESAWLYVDGKLIAWYDTAHPAKTWTMSFLLEVTGSLESGKDHILVIRVGNTGGAGGIWKPVSLMVEK